MPHPVDLFFFFKTISIFNYNFSSILNKNIYIINLTNIFVLLNSINVIDVFVLFNLLK